MPNILWLLLLCPLVAAALNGLFLRRAGVIAALISLMSALVCLAISAVMLVQDIKAPAAFHWIRIPGFQISLGLQVDQLSIGMLFVVCLVGALVHIFSLSYMADDEGKGRYFAGLSLFMFSMTGIVLSNNFAAMFIFWELVGLSSYLLIGHYHTKDSAGDAAKKAFLVNRVGDFGFMAGILMVWGLTGSLVFDDIAKAVPALGENGKSGMLTIAALLVFCGAVGKSAQMPLHVWLPDAMEGPTPVSALIHAATMVAAGVYMLVRAHVLVEFSEAGTVIAWVGAATAAFAGVVALQQSDIKRILAYSTLSQLGYMIMAVGLKGFDEAMFHLYTHAFFKALLFLAAGAVIVSCHHEQDIWKMGGLGRRMPWTFVTFAIGMAALMAVPGTSGFVSKEAILATAYEGNRVLFWIAVGVAFLTPLYMVRLLVIAFFGQARSHAAGEAKEAPFPMLLPLTLLALLSVVSAWGFVAEKFRAQVPSPESGSDSHFVTIAAQTALVLGALLGVLLYWNRSREPWRLGLLERKFYIDELYGRLVKIGQDWPGYVLYAFDQLLIGGLVVTGGAKSVNLLGRWVRRIQSGNLQAYGVAFALGMVAVLLFFLLSS